jgi:hypothetical protein
MKYEVLRYVTAHAGSQMNPILSNLLVYKTPEGAGRAQVQNGRYTVDVPSDLPPMLASAERLLAVWAACKGEPAVSLGDKFLTVTSGRLRARVAVLDPGQYPRDTPTPETAHGTADVAGVLRALLPYVADDASRPWATSICLTATHAYATNNVVLARTPLAAGVGVPINVPGRSVEAILECGDIEAVGADASSITFYLAGDVWVRCQLVAGDWPTATVDGLLDGVTGEWVAVHESLEEMLRVAAKLADSRHPIVQFKDGGLALEDDTLVASDLAPLPETGKVNAKMAALVFNTATHVQWHTPRQDVHAFRAGPVVGVFGGSR